MAPPSTCAVVAGPPSATVMASQGEGEEGAGRSQGVRASPRPLLLLMKGHPGSGKSTLAHSLASSLGWPLVDKDDLRDALLPLERRLRGQRSLTPQCRSPQTRVRTEDASGASGEDVAESELREVGLGDSLLSELNSLSYQGMWHVAGRQLTLGLSAVVDCPLARRELLDEGAELARQHGAAVAVLECTVSDEDEWRRRVEQRAEAGISKALLASGGSCRGQASGAAGSSCSGSSRIASPEDLLGLWHKPRTWADIQKLLARYDGCWQYDTAPVPKLVVDTAKHVKECYTAQALAWIRRGVPMEGLEPECICAHCAGC